jgi:hypothetical protein
MTDLKTPAYAVSYVSSVTRNRKCIHFHTKKEALKEAQQLYREGALQIDSFKYSPNIGAVSFNWRKF